MSCNCGKSCSKSCGCRTVITKKGEKGDQGLPGPQGIAAPIPTFPVDISFGLYTPPNSPSTEIPVTSHTILAGQAGLYELYFSVSATLLVSDVGVGVRSIGFSFRKNGAALSGGLSHEYSIDDDDAGDVKATITFTKHNLNLVVGDIVDVFASVNALTNAKLSGEYVVKKIT